MLAVGPGPGGGDGGGGILLSKSLVMPMASTTFRASFKRLKAMVRRTASVRATTGVRTSPARAASDAMNHVAASIVELTSAAGIAAAHAIKAHEQPVHHGFREGTSTGLASRSLMTAGRVWWMKGVSQKRVTRVPVAMLATAPAAVALRQKKAARITGVRAAP